MKKIYKSVIKLTRVFNIDIKKYPALDIRRRKRLLEQFKIDTILDVGANAGQYAEQTFKLGFKGQIFSFEPLNSVYKTLDNKAKKNPSWRTFNFGLAQTNEEIEINVSENTFSSSILNILPEHVNSAPESRVINKQKIVVKKLDDVYKSIASNQDNVLLKIDVQGYEKNVLDGAEKVLDKIKGIQIEMSLTELYKGEMLYLEMIQFLEKKGFSLHSLENGFYDEKTGRLLQVDGIFFKS